MGIAPTAQPLRLHYCWASAAACSPSVECAVSARARGPIVATKPADRRLTGFGPNECLVDEIYDQFLKDRSSVDPAWWEFFEGYTPADHSPVAAAHAEAQAVAAPAPAPESAKPAAAPPSQAPAPAPAPASTMPVEPLAAAEVTILRGAAARVVTNMEASLAVPTATSVRALPAKLLIDNRVVINNHLARARGGKVSFTHLI